MLKAAVAVLLLATTATVAAQATEYEIDRLQRVADVLPAGLRSGPHFRVKDPVVAYGYLHNFTVESDYGTFHVTGDGALRKLIREIAAIAALKEISTAEAVGESLKSTVKAPFEFAANLVRHPFDTITGIPKGVFQIFGNVATSIDMKHDPSEDSKFTQALFVSSWKRDFAAKNNVDVYSSNKALQKELNRVGWAAALTGLAISVATIPASATGVVAAKNMRLANQVGNALKQEAPARLYIINQEKLLGMGVDAALTERYLTHPAFTPRHDTIIVESLAQLNGAKNRARFIKYILVAKDEVDANFFQQMAEIMRGYHDTAGQLVDIQVVGGLLAAQSASGPALVPFPLDYGIWTRQPERLFDFLKANYRHPAFNGQIQVWISGKASAMTKRELAKRNIVVTEDVDVKIGFMD